MEEGGLVRSLVVGVFVWGSAFLAVRKLLPKRSFDFCNRIVSLLHVVVAVWLCCASVQDWRHPLYPTASAPSPAQAHTLTVSLSYFIYDFICCLFDDNISISNCFHHLVTILGLGGGLVYGTCGSELTGALWLMEVSNPFMHMRELLRELGHKDSRLSLMNDICFAVVYTFARMFFGPYLLYVALTGNNPILLKATALGLQIVSAFWFWKIAKMVYYKTIKAKKSGKAL